MGFAARSAPAAVEAILVLDIDTLVQRLPVATRAKLTWTKPRIDAGSRRLRTEPLSDQLLDEVAEDLLEPLRAVGRSVVEFMLANRDEFRTTLMDDLRREEQRISAFLPDDDSRDTLGWVLSFLRSFFGVVFTFVEAEHLAGFDDATVAELSRNREFRPFMRAQVALMAAIDSAKKAGDPERCAALVDAAFLGVTEFRSAVRAHGMWLSPFPHETSEDRRESLLRYAARLRETLTDLDWQTLDQARMGDLR